jgi:uncharacterized protein (TIGR00369 family)
MVRNPNKESFTPLLEINRAVREGRLEQYRSENLKLGMRPTSFAPGTSQWLWEEQPRAVLNQFGTLQGGYLAVFVDELFATAIASVLNEGEWAATVEVKLSFMRALIPGALAGRARVIYRTRALAFLEAQVSSASGETALTASSTWAIRSAT